MSKQIKIERKDLVLAAKDMNEVLGLSPKIATKVNGEPVPEQGIIASLTKYAKGFDDDTGKFDKSKAVNRANDALKDSTWKILEEIGAIASSKSAPVKENKSSKKEGVSTKKLNSKEDKGLKKPVTRSAGRVPKDWKTVKAELEHVDKSSALSRKYDKMLLTAQTLGEHEAQAAKICKEAGCKYLGVPTHIRWRMEVNGYTFRDKRKFQNDKDGLVQLIGVDPEAIGTKFDMPSFENSGKKEKAEKKVEKKVDKSSKKSDKSEKSEKKTGKDKKKIKK